MRTVYFNGISFESLGLILRNNPVAPCSQKIFEPISIPDGPVIFDDTGVREPITFPIECTVIQKGALRNVYALIQNKGKLVLPDEPDKYYNAILTVETPENIIMQYHTVAFNVTCEPYAYAVNNELQQYGITSSGWFNYADVTNNGTEEAEPILKVSAPYSFDIWVKDVSDPRNVCKFFFDTADVITIDVEHEIAYNSAGQNMLNRMQGDFKKLRLAAGENRISVTGMTALQVMKNERWF